MVSEVSVQGWPVSCFRPEAMRNITAIDACRRGYLPLSEREVGEERKEEKEEEEENGGRGRGKKRRKNENTRDMSKRVCPGQNMVPRGTFLDF